VIRNHLRSLLSWLNMIGSVLLAYALANPGAAAELRGMLPPSLQPYAPMLAIGWFFVVQYARARAIKASTKAQDDAA
jgi:hypothetical protein